MTGDGTGGTVSEPGTRGGGALGGNVQGFRSSFRRLFTLLELLDQSHLLDDAELPERTRNRLRAGLDAEVETRSVRSSSLHFLTSLILIPSDLVRQHTAFYFISLLLMLILGVVRVVLVRGNLRLPAGRRRWLRFFVPWIASCALFSAFATRIILVGTPGGWEAMTMNAACGLGALASIVYFAAYGRSALTYALLMSSPSAFAAFWTNGVSGPGLSVAFMWLVFILLIVPMLVRQHRDIWAGLVGTALLEARAERLAAVAAERTRFFAAVSHEIRTPLNGILGMTRELVAVAETQGGPDEETRRALRSVVATGEGLLGTLNDVLDAAKLEAGRVTLDERPFLLRALLDETVALYEPIARQNDVAIQLEVAHGLVDGLVGDDRRLRQVLVNLVGNAVKFTAGGAVVVRARTDAEDDRVRVTLEVEDTGRGFDPEDRDRLFIPFSQVDSVRAGGTGLGLSNVRHIVELMGGGVEALSEGVGRGATFRCHVVLRPSAAPARFAAPGPLVLLAEDDELSLRVAVAQLERLGCRVDVVRNGKEAVEAAARATYDAIVLDYAMPEMDGIEAARVIRRTQRMPILALTASAETTRASCLEAGINDVLLKPATVEALGSALRARLPRARS